ncbi:MAG: MBL fold metallo-hydrolase [Bacillota bacterium]
MNPVSEISVSQLKALMESGQPLFLVDVRSQADFDRWKIEGRVPVETVNTPVSEMQRATGLEGAAAAAAYARRKWAEVIPRTARVVVICPQGNTSRMVAGALAEVGWDACNLTGGMQAWGNFYESHPVVREAELSIYQIARPARGCLSYLIASRGEAVIVDPLRHTEPYLRLAEEQGWQVRAVLETHGHADHISGGPALARALGVPYYLHPYDGIHPIDVMPATLPYEYLRDGQVLTVGSARLEVLHIPGHTLGNLSFLIDRRYLLSGDSIFINSIARPDLGGKGESWAPIHYRSLSRLLALGDDLLVLPGHFSSPAEAGADGCFGAPLSELKERNEGLRMLLQGEGPFLQWLLGSLPTFPPQYVEIKRVNAGLVTPDEETASELEMGRNICALSQAYH